MTFMVRSNGCRNNHPALVRFPLAGLIFRPAKARPRERASQGGT
jgi:hypothetical protein